MEFSLLQVLLFVNALYMVTGNQVTAIPYRFPVYPVNKCPRNKTEFQTSAERRNCIGGSRYLCAPNKYMSSLIEFCTDRKRSLFGTGNCVLLEGTGDLNHYKCVEKFNSSCPIKPYHDDEIYEYPACLEINMELRCFVADKDCNKRQFPTTRIHLNISKMENVRNKNFRGDSHKWLAIAYIIIALILAGMILSWILFLKKGEKKLEDKDKSMSLLIRAQGDDKSTEVIQIDETHQKERAKLDVFIDSKIEQEPIHYNVTQPKEITFTEPQEDEKQINERILKQFLREGLLTVRHVRCIIVGCGNAGKTTLLKRLQNVPYEELLKTGRTEMVDVHVNSFEVLAEEKTIQSIKENDRLPAVVFSAEKLKKVEMQQNSASNETKYDVEKGDDSGVRKKNENPLLKGFRASQEDIALMNTQGNTVEKNNLKKEVNEEKGVLKPLSPNITTDSNQKCSHMDERNKGNSDTDSGEDDDDEKYAISKIMDAVRILKNETDLRPRITFLDFAGQNMYYAFHQIFLSPKSCSILVVDMTKCLDDKVDVTDTDEKCCSLYETWTYKDHYLFWLKSIDSFSGTKTPVLVVGTHADQLAENDGRKFFKHFFSSVNYDNHNDLRRHLNEDRKFIIGFPKQGKEMQDLKEIKKCLADIVQGSEDLEVNIRPVCAIFEQILLRQKNKKIISRKTLSNYKDKLSTQEFRIDDAEIYEMLDFFYRVGTLLYFNEDYLKDKIILDIQWFLDAFKCIIDYPLDIEGSDSKRKRFYDTGELDDDELNRIWKTCPNGGKEYLDHKTTILAYMERLGLLTPHYQHSLKSTWYYVPCMNKKKFDKTGEEFLKSSILCFNFDDEEKLPIHVFYSIVFKCFKIPCWSILTEKGQICMYDNAACFCLQEHIVVLCISKFQIQVQVWWFPEKKDDKLLEGIKESVEKILKVYSNNSHKVGYKCQNGILNSEKDKSFYEENEFPLSDFLCRTCEIDKKHPVGNDICWVLPAKNMDNQRNNAKSSLEETAISDILVKIENSHEETDEGRTSIKHILQACLDGNVENFLFHLKKEIRNRKHLLLKTNKDGWNVMHFAAKGGNLKIFRHLQSEGLDLCPKTHAQMTVLHIASQSGHYDLCKYILENSEFEDILTAKSASGKNACHYAAEFGSVKIFKILVAKDINPEETTNNGQNVFHIACIYNKLEICRHISKYYPALIHNESEERWNATLHAAKNGHTNVLKFLKAEKVSFEHKSESDRNALHIACDNGHFEACKYISEKFPSLLKAVDHKGRYASHFAARGGNLQIMKYLDSKTEVTRETNVGMNILHMACLHKHVEMCSYILNRYPELNVKRTENGWTTAHFVAGNGNTKGHEIEIFEMLLKAEETVDIMALTKKRNSVLTLAIKYNAYAFAKYLFENYPTLLKIQGVNSPYDTENEDPKMLTLLENHKGELL